MRQILKGDSDGTTHISISRRRVDRLAFCVPGRWFETQEFAGLFGAAPSVGLATLALTVVADGKTYASIEARSMTAGAVALFAYGCIACRLMMRFQWKALPASVSALVLWAGIAFAFWIVLLR